MTNDDGIEALGFRLLVQALHRAGHAIIVFAPAENQSATSMSINLNTSMKLRQRSDLINEWNLCTNTDSAPIHLYELHGRPCDTIIVALDGGLQRLIKDIEPRLVISGVNLGPNLSQDSLHSGTMGAAREAGLYGMPAIASSFASFEPEGIENAIAATVELVESALKVLPIIPQNRCRPHIDITANHISRWPDIPQHPAWESDPITALRNAFRHGELMLNLNVPHPSDPSTDLRPAGNSDDRLQKMQEEAAAFFESAKPKVATTSSRPVGKDEEGVCAHPTCSSEVSAFDFRCFDCRRRFCSVHKGMTFQCESCASN